MRIIRFISDTGTTHFGWVEEDGLETLAPEHPVFLLRGNPLDSLKKTASKARVKRLLTPVDPPNVLALGLNYRSHADETGVPYPEDPVLFLKATTSLLPHGAPIVLPAAGNSEVDFEGELAVVMGSDVKNVGREEALESILGYCCANDVSARDWQLRKQKRQWARGKSFDTFCPLGPWLVTRDRIPDPGHLILQTRINGELLQDASTADMIFDVAAVISHLSRSLTLRAGTVILTGTPAGVGFTRTPPVFLKAGDRVSVRIEGIGELINPVISETVRD